MHRYSAYTNSSSVQMVGCRLYISDSFLAPKWFPSDAFQLMSDRIVSVALAHHFSQLHLLMICTLSIGSCLLCFCRLALSPKAHFSGPRDSSRRILRMCFLPVRPLTTHPVAKVQSKEDGKNSCKFNVFRHEPSCWITPSICITYGKYSKLGISAECSTCSRDWLTPRAPPPTSGKHYHWTVPECSLWVEKA
jgi:hypothetical protein